MGQRRRRNSMLKKFENVFAYTPVIDGLSYRSTIDDRRYAATAHLLEDCRELKSLYESCRQRSLSYDELHL